jgi:colicin import membrane protein
VQIGKLLWSERSDKAVAGAQAKLDRAERHHLKRADSIATERTALEKRAQAEDDRWDKLNKKLENALRRER